MTRIVCGATAVAVTQASNGAEGNGSCAVTDADCFAKSLHEAMASGPLKQRGRLVRSGANVTAGNQNAAGSGPATEKIRNPSDARIGRVGDVVKEEEHLQEETPDLNKSGSQGQMGEMVLTTNVGLEAKTQSGLHGSGSGEESRKQLATSMLGHGQLNGLRTAPGSVEGTGQDRFPSKGKLSAHDQNEAPDIHLSSVTDGERQANRIVTVEKAGTVFVKGVETHLAVRGLPSGDRERSPDALAIMPSKPLRHGGGIETHDGLLRDDDPKEPKASISMSKAEANADIRGVESMFTGLFEQHVPHGLSEGDVSVGAGVAPETASVGQFAKPTSEVMKSVTLQVTPDDLGPIELVVSRSENSVSVRMIVQDEIAVAALAGEREELINLLDGLGLQLDQLLVSRAVAEKASEPEFPKSDKAPSSGTPGTGTGDRSPRGSDQSDKQPREHTDYRRQNTKHATLNHAETPAMSNQQLIPFRRAVVL